MNIWSKYSKKLSARIDRPLSSGLFEEKNGSGKGMRVVLGASGSIDEVNRVVLYWMVDERDGVIADVKFQVYGPSALIGAADAACELLLRKNYDQAQRITADLIDKQMRDRSEEQAFPDQVGYYLNIVLEAIEDASGKCTDIPFAEAYVAPPMNDGIEGESRVYSGWQELSLTQQIHVIEEVMAAEIRPYIELDAGGVQVLNVVDGREVIIAYQGNCTSCHSATGATLTAIQQILKNRVHPELFVTPDASFLTTEPLSK